ncbi:MAG: hypothetical protein DMH00_06945 [Acidobacteria bacterium]|nr:MAG: hypothetical protein DMH00_06945 [Acidobacteriota bacterium]
MGAESGVVERVRRALLPVTGLPLLLGLAMGGLLLALWGRDIRSGAFLIGDCPYYASTAVSLWVDGDMNLENQLRGGLAVHQKQVALGRRGECFPKHPVLMSVLSVPFYALFGIAGFLVFNALVGLLLLTVVWALCRRFVGPPTATAATVLVFAGSFLRGYAYNYSPDLFSTLLVLAGILLIFGGRPFPGGILLGVSVLAKVTNLFVAALVVTFLCFRRPRIGALAAGAGLLPGMAAWTILNLAMFGSPTTTGYDRTLVLQDGTVTTVSHRAFFDLPVWEGIRAQLIDPRVGLLTTSPLLLLALPGWLPLLKKHRWEGLLILGLGEFLFLFFSTYRWWATSHYGNRFLMVPVCLCAVPMAFTLDALSQHLRGLVHARTAAPEPLRHR